jgi:hypothetical protein
MFRPNFQVPGKTVLIAVPAPTGSRSATGGLIPVRDQAMNNQVNTARIRRSLPRDAGWHPGPEVDWMLGAADLSVIQGARSDAVCYQ